MGLVRSCGVAAVLGGALWQLWGGALFLVPGPVHRVWLFVALIVPLLFSVALVGLYATLTGWWKILGGIGLVLAGTGLLFSLCWSVWGQVLPMADVKPVCSYFVERGLPQYLLSWVAYFCAALVLMGLAVLRARALGPWSVVPLTGGFLGCAFYVTDFASTGGLLLVHVAFGVLFGLSWMVLGYTLWTWNASEFPRD